MSVNLAKLEQHLLIRSCVNGYTPSQADIHVFNRLSAAPDASKTPNVARWYAHIQSYTAEHASLPGSSNGGETFFRGGDDDGEEEDDAEAERIRAERVAAYNARNANRARPVAKSLVTLDVKSWDAETDMAELEAAVRSIEKDGLLWGASKLVPIGYGVRKLQITLVVEDKVSTDELQEKIAEFDDYVQSTDVAAMQKL